MKLNDILEVNIVRVGDSGEGIALVDNQVVFIPYAPKDSRVKIKVTKVSKKYASAELIEVLSSKSELLTPFCENFTKCGGCDLQHMTYPSQLSFKRQKIENLLYKFLRTRYPVSETIPSDNIVKYRNKIQLQVGFVNKKVVVGFFNKNSHDIVPITHCDLYEDWATTLIKIFTTWANKERVTVYNEKTSRGILRNVVARNIANKLVVTVVINGDKLDLEGLRKALENEFSSFSLYLSINKRKNSQILGDKLIKVYDEEDLVTVDGIKLSISPYSFFQVNDNVRRKLYSEVTRNIHNDIIIDAYSGIGVLSTQLAKNAKYVFGIEIVEDAVKNADEIVSNNVIYGEITNILGDTAIILPKLVKLLESDNREELVEFLRKNTLRGVNEEKINVAPKNISIVLDPPRKGCDMSVIQAVIESGAKEVAYISCDPATLCRDLTFLVKEYNIKKVQPFDLFPETCHVETLVILTRSNKD